MIESEYTGVCDYRHLTSLARVSLHVSALYSRTCTFTYTGTHARTLTQSVIVTYRSASSAASCASLFSTAFCRIAMVALAARCSSPTCVRRVFSFACEQRVHKHKSLYGQRELLPCWSWLCV